MDSLIFAFNAVAPIVIMVAIGYFLKRAGIIGKDFAKTGNRLVFKIFLPVMLFTNVYKIENILDFDFSHVWYSLAMIVAIYLIAIAASGFIVKDAPKRGSLIQGIFRSNYILIGLPLVNSLFGDAGMGTASILCAFAIPFLNILAVMMLSTMIKNGKKVTVKKVAGDIMKNPLVQSVIVGFAVLFIREIFVAADISFRLYDIAPVAKVLDYISTMATPFSLIVLGADFEFSAIAELRKEIVFGTVMRCVFVPVLGIGTALLLFGGKFDGAQIASIAALFSAPVAVASVPMAQEMGADTPLAGQLVVWTTVFSAPAIFIVSFLLKAGGIF